MAEAALACQGLDYLHQGSPLLEGVSLSLAAGQRVLVLGQPRQAVGAFMRLAATLEPPSRGSIRVLGQPPEALDQWGLLDLRRRIGLVRRASALISNITLEQNITLGLRYHLNLSPTAAADRVDGLLERLGLELVRDQRPAGVSLEQQRLAVYARELAMEPELLLLEMPGLDLGGRQYVMMREAALEVSGRLGTTLLLGSVDPAAEPAWYDAVLLLQQGRASLLPAGQFDPGRHWDQDETKADE